MTVSYTAEVSRCTRFGSFLKLLLRWRASIYKLIWLDMSVFMGIYYTINATYRYLLNEEQKAMFEVFVKYCSHSSTLIPLMFVLGFYVSIVVKRWWEQYMTLPWPDSTAVYVSSLIRGHDENGRRMRRTIMRYVCLSLTMVLTMISPRVKRRFPTVAHLVDLGLLVENEMVILQNMNEKFSKYPQHWMPIVWASSIVTRARKEGRIRDDSSVKTLIDSLNSFRGMCMSLLFYDTISIPLVYTQVVTIAVYSYLLTTVFGRQWTGQDDPDGILNMVDYFFPFFTVLEYMFFMGWLKVAESLICPFGDGDDDFEVNWLIDRNLQVSYLIVDEMHNEHPELIKDQYWDEIFPRKMPYENVGTNKRLADFDKLRRKRTSFKQSLTRFFAKHHDHEHTQTLSVAGNLNEIDSALRRLLSPPHTSHRITETETIIPFSSDKVSDEETYDTRSRNSAENDDDDFEKLKKQRQQERMSRQSKFTLKGKMEDEEDLKGVSSRISEGSQPVTKSSSSVKSTDVVKSSETKKNV